MLWRTYSRVSGSTITMYAQEWREKLDQLSWMLLCNVPTFDKGMSSCICWGPSWCFGSTLRSSHLTLRDASCTCYDNLHIECEEASFPGHRVGALNKHPMLLPDMGHAVFGNAREQQKQSYYCKRSYGKNTQRPRRTMGTLRNILQRT